MFEFYLSIYVIALKKSLSFRGSQFIYDVPLFNKDAELFIISDYKNQNLKVLANGDLLYVFDCPDSGCISDADYWLNPFSTVELSSIVSGNHNIQNA